MKSQQGLTLVELLVTLAILAILASVALPGFQGMLARNNLATSANAVLSAVNLARGEAVRQSAPTTLVALNSADAANEWGPGWQVRNTAVNAPAAPCVAPGCIIQSDGVPAGLTRDSPGNVTFLRFTSRGALQGAIPVELDLCNAGVGGVKVTVSAVGRPSTSNLTAAECP